MLGSSNHKMLVPVTMLAGSCIALLCNILMVMPGTNNILPLNAMLGAPVIIYVIVNRKISNTSTDEYARTCNRSQPPQYWLPAERRKRKVIHDDLNLRLQPGEVTCLLGLNGAGKSTLLRTLCGFQPPLRRDPPDGKTVVFLLSKQLFTDGRCCTDGKDECGRHHRLRTGVFGPSSVHRFFGQLKKTDREIIEQSLTAAGIAHKAQNYVSELSDGERRKP